MVCHITQTWRGSRLSHRVTVADLIAATTTETGLTGPVRYWHENSYAKGIKVLLMRRWPYPQHRERPMAS